MIVCPYKDLGRYAPVIPGLEEAMKAIDAMTEWTPGTEIGRASCRERV